MYLFQNGFIAGDLGYASAIGWTLTMGVLVISLAQMRLTGQLLEKGGLAWGGNGSVCMRYWCCVVMLTPMVWLIAATIKGPDDLFHYLFFSFTVALFPL